MKEVMISIRKEHNDLILSGTKRWEGRKRIPKELAEVASKARLVEPIEFYVYEPLQGGGCGKVRYKFKSYGAYKFLPIVQDEYEWMKIAEALCVAVDWAKRYYLNADKGYLIRIEDVEEFDKLKELSEFWTIKCTKNYKTCGECKDKPDCVKDITRPPQSWCYVLEEE